MTCTTDNGQIRKIQGSSAESGWILRGTTSWYISPSSVTLLLITLTLSAGLTMKLSCLMSPILKTMQSFLFLSQTTACLLKTTVLALISKWKAYNLYAWRLQGIQDHFFGERNGYNSETGYFWPHVGKAKMCLTTTQFFQFLKNLFTFLAVCLQKIV